MISEKDKILLDRIIELIYDDKPVKILLASHKIVSGQKLVFANGTTITFVDSNSNYLPLQPDLVISHPSPDKD